MQSGCLPAVFSCPWSFALSSSSAEQGGEDLTEVFLHSRSTINAEEFAGYKDACPSGVKIVGVPVRTDFNDVKMFRPGEWPVIRGTFWKLNDHTGYLWASGFKPSLLTYHGWEVPNPLRIDIEHGGADLEQVATDILGLTKLNYNTCKLGDSVPVTIGFSDAVEEILIANPGIKKSALILSSVFSLAVRRLKCGPSCAIPNHPPSTAMAASGLSRHSLVSRGERERRHPSRGGSKIRCPENLLR